MTRALVVCFLLLASVTARAECEMPDDSRLRNVLGMRLAMSSAPTSKDYELGLRFSRAEASCDGPFYAAVGAEAGTQLTRAGFEGVYASGLGRIVIGHAPPFGFELGVGARYDRKHRLGWFIYAGAYLSLYYLEGGGRYEWGIGRANRASAEGLIHVPFDGSGPARF